jgi:hypothetical protein
MAMTFREINLLQPGDWVSLDHTRLYKFIKVNNYVRNKPYELLFYSFNTGNELHFTRYDLQRLFEVVDDSDTRIKVIETLYGPF